MEIVKDGHTWTDALEKRNQLAHTYDEQRSLEAENLIRNRYFQILEELKDYFNERQ